MQTDETAKRIALIERLGFAFGRTLPEKTVEIYVEKLAKIQIEDLESKIEYAIGHYDRMPAIATLLKSSRPTEVVL